MHVITHCPLMPHAPPIPILFRHRDISWLEVTMSELSEQVQQAVHTANECKQAWIKSKNQQSWSVLFLWDMGYITNLMMIIIIAVFGSVCKSGLLIKYMF